MAEEIVLPTIIRQSPFHEDMWNRLKEVHWGEKSISPVVAIATVTGPGGAGAGGDIVPGTPQPFAIIGRAIRFQAYLDALIRLDFISGSQEDGSPPVVSIADLHNFNNIVYNPVTFHSEYVNGEVIYARAVEALAPGLSISGPNVVNVFPLDGQTTGGSWGVEFIFMGLRPPGYVDLVRSSSVIRVAPAPPEPPLPPPAVAAEPNTVGFGIQGTASDPAEIANLNTVTVTGYQQMKPTPAVPEPPAMVFTGHADGTITVEGGELLWTFTQSHPDLIAYSPGSPAPDTEVTVKFNSKGLVL